MVRLYIIRHGDPDYDTNREQGGSLTPHGRLEAEALGPYLKDEGITHVYSSPMGRARLTAELALKEHMPELADQIGIEPWTRELSTWRQKSALGGNLVDIEGSVGEGTYQTEEGAKKSTLKKPRAVWDIPSSITRTQLSDCIKGTEGVKNGWKSACPDYTHHVGSYEELCKSSDVFLARHGIVRNGQRYAMCKTKHEEYSKRRIAVFCHAGFGMTWLAHLLGIPLPLMHASFYLPPSSVSVILFDEHNNFSDLSCLESICNHDHNTEEEKKTEVSSSEHIPDPKKCVWMTPRSLCIGGTNHLSMKNLKTSNSKYENWERPSGIKTNFW